MIAALAIAVLLSPAAKPASTVQMKVNHKHVHKTVPYLKKNLAVDLHAMTDEEKRMYPGRERFDKTEWYESQFKSAKVVTIPEHVDEWHNGGLDMS